jgi:hypothetical protein
MILGRTNERKLFVQDQRNYRKEESTTCNQYQVVKALALIPSNLLVQASKVSNPVPAFLVAQAHQPGGPSVAKITIAHAYGRLK